MISLLRSCLLSVTSSLFLPKIIQYNYYDCLTVYHYANACNICEVLSYMNIFSASLNRNHPSPCTNIMLLILPIMIHSRVSYSFYPLFLPSHHHPSIILILLWDIKFGGRKHFGKIWWISQSFLVQNFPLLKISI